MPLDPDLEQLELTRARRRRQRLLAIAIAAIVGVPVIWLIADDRRVASEKTAAKLTAEQKVAATFLLNQRDALARQRVESWNAAIRRDALAALTSGSNPCPLALAPPTQAAAAEYVKYATHSPAFGKWTLCILRPADDPKTCVRSAEVDPWSASLRSKLAADDAYRWDLEGEKNVEDPPAVLVIVGEEVRPVVSSPGVGKVSFVPGTVAARAYLYSPEKGRFICAGDVSARNSKNVEIEVTHFGETPSAQQSTAEHETRLALERDLEMHLRFAMSPALREASGP